MSYKQILLQVLVIAFIVGTVFLFSYGAAVVIDDLDDGLLTDKVRNSQKQILKDSLENAPPIHQTTTNP